MTKFEYSDFYRFIASVGIALISLSVFVPWLFLREPFDLLQKNDDISHLTPQAQSIILGRQVTVELILRLMPYFSFLLFGLGVIALLVGGGLWLTKTQKLIDEINKLELETRKKQLAIISPEESKAQREEDIKAQYEESEDKLDRDTPTKTVEEILKPDELSDLVENAYRIENRLTGLLDSCYGKSYTVLTERRLGPVSLDIVMLAKTSQEPDYIFDFKYIQKGFKYYWLREAVLKIIYASQIYQQQTNRTSVPAFIVVFGEKVTHPSKKEKQTYLNRIQNETDSLGTSVVIKFISESE